MAEAPSQLPSPFDLSVRSQSQEMVRQALDRLPESYREALVLFYRADCSAREIAATLGVSSMSARQLLSRGRRLLRKEIEQIIAQDLKDTRPTAAFTTAVMAAFDAVAVVHPRLPSETLRRELAGIGRTLRNRAIVKTMVLATTAGTILSAGVGISYLSQRDEALLASKPDLTQPLSRPAHGRQAVARDASITDAPGRTADRRPGPEAPATGTLPKSADLRAKLQRRVTLDFKEADAPVVLNFLSEITEVDIIVRDTLDTKLTLTMRDVPAIDALDEVLAQMNAERTEIPILKVIPGEVEGELELDGGPVTADLDKATIQEVVDLFGRYTDIPIVVAQGSVVPPKH